jgi:hypothetical protein
MAQADPIQTLTTVVFQRQVLGFSSHLRYPLTHSSRLKQPFNTN